MSVAAVLAHTPSWLCPIMSRLWRRTRWWGCMTSCGWPGWPARSSRANLFRPVGLAASTRLALASPSTDGLQGLRGVAVTER